MIASLLLLSFLAQSQPAAAPQDPSQNEPKCKLEGQVVSGSTGSPLKHASLRLTPSGPIAPGGTRTAFTSSTDNEGKFVMENVDPGTYTLSAERSGYIRQQYGARSANSGGTPLKLASGQSMKDLLFKMVPQGMVFGKVVDDDGEPVANAQIKGQRWRFFNGKRQLVPSGYAASQADGTFVIGDLQEGRFYLSADYRTNGFNNEVDVQAGKKDDGFLKTYYPNGLDFNSAAAIEITPGAQIRGIEIHMRRGRLFEIRGRVQNATSGPMPDNVSLFIFQKTDMPFFSGQNQAFAQGKKKEFLFKNLVPGTYIIQTINAVVVATDASGDTRQAAQLYGRVEVTIGDDDIENLVVSLNPCLEIPGTLRMDGDSSQQAPPSWTNFTVFLRTIEPTPFGTGANRASDQGNFKIRNVSPGIFRVSVNGTPDGSYVKAIRFGGEDFTNKDLDLTSGAGGDLEIVISPNAADISGVVRNEDGEAVPGVSVQAFLGNEVKKNANTDQNGAFHFTSLAPGDYRVYAWEDIEPGMSQDAEFRKNFDSKASVAKLEEKGHESLEVKLIPKDAIETEAAKIR